MDEASAKSGKDALRMITKEGGLGERLGGKIKSMVASRVEKTVAKVRAVHRGSQKLSSDELDFILADMFVNTSDWTDAHAGDPSNLSSVHDMQGSKGAPHGGLLSMLALYLAVVFDKHGGMASFAELWKEFVLELRWHWENLKPLSRLTVNDGPDMRTCLLHQKLQMLECCINQQNTRNKLKEDATAATQPSLSSSFPIKPVTLQASPTSDDGDEFFLAPEDDEGVKQRLDRIHEEVKQEQLSLAQHPRGVKSMSSIKLTGSDEPLRIPITQDSGSLSC